MEAIVPKGLASPHTYQRGDLKQGEAEAELWPTTADRLRRRLDIKVPSTF